VSSEPGIDAGRFGRTLVLIGFVTTVFLFLIADRLSGDTFRIGAIAIGTVALITAITGFLIAAGSAVEGH
jgi:ABC-type enterobactin transport system permease subunit